MLKATQIRKAYDNLEILKSIDLEVAQNEIVAITGSSGAGKTTLLQILGTLEKPDGGILNIGGINPFSLSSNKLSLFRNQNLGFIFQFHQLLPEFSAVENAMLPALIGGDNQKDAQAKAKRYLDMLNLSHRYDHKPAALSGGEQQRVAVARALINSPKIILADEPTGNLDSKNSEDMHAIFLQLREELGQTFIIVTHNPNLAALADRQIQMSDGNIFTDGKYTEGQNIEGQNIEGQ